MAVESHTDADRVRDGQTFYDAYTVHPRVIEIHGPQSVAQVTRYVPGQLTQHAQGDTETGWSIRITPHASLGADWLVTDGHVGPVGEAVLRAVDTMRRFDELCERKAHVEAEFDRLFRRPAERQAQQQFTLGTP